MDTQFDNIINQFNENVNNTCNSQPTNQRNTRCTDNSDIQNGIPIIQDSPMTDFAPTSNTAVPRSKTATTSNQSSYSLQTQYHGIRSKKPQIVNTSIPPTPLWGQPIYFNEQKSIPIHQPLHKGDTSKPTITCPTPIKMSPQQSEPRILSFNCKNVKTIAPFIENMRNQVDIILLQEHWLFDHELNLLDELNSHFCGKGKSINSGKNTCDLLIKSVRGYGGVAILWDRSIDQYVKPIIDGNNRIQCIELALKNPILLVSAYLPTKAENDKFEEFSECIDQLFEIIQKYELTHNLVIGGDFNEDISKINNSRRALKLKKIIDECNMKVDFKGPTFINVKGEEISEIDYFIYKTEVTHKTSRLTDVASNVSDHHPIKITLPCKFLKKEDILESNVQSRIRWDKVDINKYSNIIAQETPMLKEKLQNQQNSVTTTIEQTMEMLSNTAKKCSAQKTYGKNKLKLKLWNPEIKHTLHQNKIAYKNWKNADRPNDPEHPLVIVKKETRKLFRTELRKEENKRKHIERDRIITANTQNKRLFYQLIKKQRNNKNIFINDLHVSDKTYENEEVINGWHNHFKTLAEPIQNSTYDSKHQKLCEVDYQAIKYLCNQASPRIVIKSELIEAIKSINTGKSEDIFGLSIEHILNAGDDFTDFLLYLVNIIIHDKLIPEIIKLGLLSPIFKNKGSKNDSKNYRGIVVLPILCKIIEYIARIDFRPILLEKQSPLQRGFTPNTSPLNAAIIFEEIYREYTDCNSPFYIDAKSAFDVVIINMLMRKLFLLDIDPATWSIIDELHKNTSCSIKWKNQLSQEFKVYQGVKQGGLLSADLYKLYMESCLIGTHTTSSYIYIEDLLSLYENSTLGCKIGNININAVACADDIALLTDNPYDLQILVNHALQYSQLHYYTLQSQKSVIIQVENKAKKTANHNWNFNLDNKEMPNLDKSTHLGIIRSTTKSKSDTFNTEQNITKARRTAYSLLSAGLLPIEAQIDTKSLTLFNNICRQNNRSKEKQLAYRQLLIKPDNSNSWYIAIKKLLYKYDFSDIIQFLDNPPKKFEWKNIIQKKVDLYWIHKIIQNSRSYPTLTYLNCDIFLPRKIHPIIDLNNDNNPSKGALSIAIKLKLVTGTFMTQSKRASFTKSESPLCKLCDDEDEDIEHLLLKCKVLEPIRSPFINQIEDNILKDASISFYKLSTNTQTQLIMDCTKLRHQNSHLLLNRKTEQLCELISRKLCYALHTIRARTIKSCIKIHRCNVSEVEECIAETLKHAPAQKDGPRYKKRPETNKRPADQRAENQNLE
ncbi:unnamed protein product [Mytilus coruscus]|uniref:Reverse transcriptase domain-containing protein n=1 Tax=Mytilus coruscus TaxID=42192 RepID=A0A6J8CG56_MYTCO|nr:unnamed protein product [Mytilus coruscus]